MYTSFFASHEGGYSIEKVDNHEYRLNEQFAYQQYNGDMSLSEVENALRNNRESFKKVRSLFPTRYRFHIIDTEGRDIRNWQALPINSAGVERGAIDHSSPTHHSTHVECAEHVRICSANGSLM
ncbi:MAG: hypothetical protein AB8B87_22045 [Granulosicoccus sp.]